MSVYVFYNNCYRAEEEIRRVSSAPQRDKQQPATYTCIYNMLWLWWRIIKRRVFVGGYDACNAQLHGSFDCDALSQRELSGDVMTNLLGMEIRHSQADGKVL